MTTPLLREVKRREDSYTPPDVIPRAEFLTDYWDYTPGHHVTILAPTQWGKTTFCYQLLDTVSTPKLPTYVLVIKPRSPVTERWGKRLGFKTIRQWPMPVQVVKRRGYNLWPRHTKGDPAANDKQLAAIFGRALDDLYHRGNCQILADESTGFTDDLNLARHVSTIHKRGAEMRCGMWVTDQRPFYVVQTAYSQAEHLFIGKSTDARDRKRYGEIGGIDPYVVDRATLGLEKYQWLYIRRTGPQMCIVDK